MEIDGGKREYSRADSEKFDPQGLRRTTFMGRALKAVMAIITIAAVLACIPYRDGADFPMMGLLIYVIGMAFVTMPLCLWYEWLLKVHQENVTRAQLAAH
ncbi:hypothetical protein QTI66_18745 [Variovorax sp. J22R133]|uniref:hypothetical protein n=1 Tax=Variovorax brevis TaxID=3053503 RepID=UPI002577D72C|nr:hypothetical protein [Variovorax sp. J22R133]MDM0114199.1 hypothetical protein [Variovorax sp. J22R133]